MSAKNENNKLPQAAVHALDTLLGLAMLLIVFDYAREFLSEAQFMPTDLHKTTPSIFLSRWVTHFGAPILFFAAGLHIAFKQIVGWDKTSLALYLVKRGLLLIVFDLTIVSLAINFGFAYPFYFFMLAALGVSFFILALIVFMPMWVSLMLGLVVVLGHDLLPVVKSMYSEDPSPFMVLLHGRGGLNIFGQTIFVIYSVIPWVGLVLLGYGLGVLYEKEAEKRQKYLMYLGAAFTIGFIVLRFLNDYGDPKHWWPHDERFFTFFAFINVTKFPASVQYLLLTMGPSLMLLSWLEGRTKHLFNRAAIFGKTALFYYFTSLYLIHILTVLAGSSQGFQPIEFIVPMWQYPDGYGFSSGPILFFTVLLTMASYPLCRWIDSKLPDRFTSLEKHKSLPIVERVKASLCNL